MIPFNPLNTVWPKITHSGLPRTFNPKNFRALNCDELLELKEAAIEQGHAVVTNICATKCMEMMFYEFEENEFMRHPAKLLVIDCTDYGIALSE